MRSEIRALTRTRLAYAYGFTSRAPIFGSYPLEVQPSLGVLGMAKISLRTNLRRADKIEFENCTLSQRKFFVVSTLGTRNIRKFS